MFLNVLGSVEEISCVVEVVAVVVNGVGPHQLVVVASPCCMMMQLIRLIRTGLMNADDMRFVLYSDCR